MFPSLLELIRAALKEDMPSGDLTTESLAMTPRWGRAQLFAKENLVVSGTVAFEECFRLLEPQLDIHWHFRDGQSVLKGQIVAALQGDLLQFLKAERVALNFLGHLSGVATLTRAYVDQVKHTKTKILDTRKTLPIYRELEKRAVRDGGGQNHRLNLSESILIKENHAAVAGGIQHAIDRIRMHTTMPVEVEAHSLKEVQEAVHCKPNRILLDNMSDDLIEKCVEIIPPTIETEATGNMTLERVAKVAELGVHFISVGALTHSAPSADYSMIFQWHDSKEKKNAP